MFKDIPGYEGLYAVNERGDILSYAKAKNKFEERLLTPRYNNSGYLRVTLFKNSKRAYYLIHRLVAQVFIPNLNNLPEVNHKDLDRLNNNVENLEWCDRSYNCKHAYNNGIKVKSHLDAIRNKSSLKTRKVSFGEAEEIRKLYLTGNFTKREIAKKFGVNRFVVEKITRNETYKDSLLSQEE